MAYRVPTSDIYLIKNVLLDSDYKHTIRFDDRHNQLAYFLSSPNNYLHYAPTSYQRKGAGTIQIDGYCEDLQFYNYLIFANKPININYIDYDDVIYFCFIDRCDYINDNCTQITYTIDVMQTYMFYYTLGMSFVEREHTETDELYGNIVPENFGYDDYEMTQVTAKTFNAFSLQILYVPNNKYIYYWYYSGNQNEILFHEENVGSFITGNIMNDTFTGMRKVSFPFYYDQNIGYTETLNNVLRCLELLKNSQATICEMSVVPTALCKYNTITITTPTGTITGHIDDTTGHGYSYEEDITVTMPTMFSDSQGNVYSNIKNKKLLTSPFMNICVSNMSGEHNEYMPQNFLSASPISFKAVGVLYGQPEISLIPLNYNGVGLNYDARINLNDFPHCTWNEETAQNYWAQNKSRIALELITNAFFIAMGVHGRQSMRTMQTSRVSYRGNPDPSVPFSKRVAGLTKWAANRGDEFEARGLVQIPTQMYVSRGGYGLLGLVGDALSIANTPDTLQGKQSYSQIPIISGNFGFKVFVKAIKPYEARIIDDYFSMFGYAIKELKVPNLFNPNASLRPHWNYLKTSYCHVEPYHDNTSGKDRCVPHDIEDQITQIFNNGITFWESGGEIADYSYDNSPITNP